MWESPQGGRKTLKRRKNVVGEKQNSQKIFKSPKSLSKRGKKKSPRPGKYVKVRLKL